MKFKDSIKNVLREFNNLGFLGIFPNLEIGSNKITFTDDEIGKFTEDHFKAIDHANALYVLCPNGYIGKSVTLEIGYAKIRIFLYIIQGRLMIKYWIVFLLK